MLILKPQLNKTTITMCSEPYISSNGFYIYITSTNLNFINGKFIICDKASNIIYPFEGILQLRKASNYEFSFIIDWHPEKIDRKSYTAFFGRCYQNLNQINLKWALWYKNNNSKEIVYSGSDNLNKSNNEEIAKITMPSVIYKSPHPFFIRSQKSKDKVKI